MVGYPKRVVLVCEECGEKVVLGGPASVWHSGRTVFECECGQRLTLANREAGIQKQALVGRYRR